MKDMYLLFKKKSQNHTVPHTQQGWQKEHSAKTLCSPFSPELWRHLPYTISVIIFNC